MSAMDEDDDYVYAYCRNVTVYADANCQAQVFAHAFDNGSYGSGTMSYSISPAGPFSAGVHTVTFTATSTYSSFFYSSTESATCTATLTVLDATAPQIERQAHTVYLDQNGQGSVAPTDVVTSVTDNCGINTANVTVSPTTFDCSNIGSGSTGTGTQNGTVSGTLTVDNSFEWYISTDDNQQGTLVGTGNAWSTIYNYTANLTAGQNYYLHVKATDAGLVEMFVGKFSLTGDFEFADGSQNLTTNPSDWKVSPTGWSNYESPILVGAIGYGPWGNLSSLQPAQLIWHGAYNTAGGETKYFTAPIYPKTVGSNLVNITATDNAGNVRSTTAPISVLDTIKPVANVNNMTVQLNSAGTATISVADIDAGSTDNCGIVSSSLDKTTFNCNDAGQTVPVTLTVADASGNTRSATAMVTVLNPDITANDDVFNNISTGQPFTFSAADLTANDVEYCGQALQVDVVNAPSAGTIVDNYDGTFTYTPTGNTNQTVTASYVVKRNDGTISYSGNGHFYEFVVSPGISWDAAKAAAESMSYNGMQGYLATVTSAGENAFVSQKLNGEGWIGATDAETEKTWKWVTGPEAGTAFYNQNTQSAINGAYSNWSVGEPNDFKYGNPSHPGEDYAHYWYDGNWNDYPVTSGSINGYIVEYGGMPGDGNNNSTATANITFNVVDAVPPTVVTQNITLQLDLTGQVSITPADIDNGSSDASGIASMSLDKLNFNCNNVGQNTVTLTVIDNNGNSNSGTATVTVLDVLPVVANDDAFSVGTGQSITFTAADLMGNDTDPYGQPLQVDAVTPASSGTLVDNLNGTFTFTPSGVTNQTVTASYVVKRNDGTIVNSANGHFYEFVTAPGISWTSAKVAAENRTYNGMQGYLATVTSAAENGFVVQKLEGEGWIGASDAAVEGTWRWVTGPEAGTHFFQRTYHPQFFGYGYYSTSVINGEYNNWASGEPNNAGDEDYAHYWSHGLWNDFPNQVGSISGYIVEYGGMAGDCNTASTSTANITFNVTDATPPTVLTQNVTVYVDASGQASVSAAQVDNGSSDPSGVASMSLDMSTFDCSHLGSNTVNLTVVDNYGNAGSASAIVTVVDTVSPTATAVSGTLDILPSRSVTVQRSYLLSLVNASDNCNMGIIYFRHAIDGQLMAGRTYNCNDVGTVIDVNVEIPDASGNQIIIPIQLTVTDVNSNCNTPPVAICNSFTAPADADCEAKVFAQAFNGGSYDPDGSIVSQTISPAGPFGLGTHQVTYTVTDNYGASTSCVATLTVADQNGPSIVTVNPTVSLDANGQASITTADVVASATDNCSPSVNLSLSQSTFDCTDLIANIGNASPGTLSGTFTADNELTVYVSTSDNAEGTAFGSGNNWGSTYSGSTNLAAAQKYYIHVKATDWGGPEFFAGKFNLTGGFQFANGTQSLNTNAADWKVSSTGWNNYTTPQVVGQAGQQHSIWGNGVNTLAPAYLIWSGNWNTGGGETRYFTAEIFPIIPGSNVTVTGTDAAGNTTNVTATVDIVDMIAPTAVVNNPTIVLDANGNGTISMSDIDGGSYDNCGIASASIDVTSVDCSNLNATVPVTLTLTDASGNITTATSMVSVVDNDAPTAVLASNITVLLDANGQGSLTVADVDGGSYDNCGISASSIDVTSFSCADVGTVPVTLTLTDASGNSSTAVAQVSVVDNVAPTALCQNITVDLPVNGPVVISGSDIDAGSYDNCGVASVSVSPSSFDCSAVGVNTVTLTVTDVNGNTSTCTATVTVVKSPLVVSSIQSDFNGFGVSCFGGANGSIDLTVSGACEPYSYVWSNGASSEDVSGLSAGTYSVIIYDGNGDSYNYAYTITEPTPLASTTAMIPYNTVSGQQDSTIFLGYGPQSVDLNASASGGVAGYTYAWSPAAGLSSTSGATVTAAPTATTTYTVTITDANGCTMQKNITVYVIDARDPNNPNKVVLCHLRRKKNVQTWGTISVSSNAVPAHLGHGDILGPCNNGSKAEPAVSITVEEMHALLYPNPTNTTSTLAVEIHRDQEVRIALFDYRGAQIALIHDGFMSGDVEHHFDLDAANLAAGMYTLVIYTAENTESLRWTIVR